MNDLIKKFLTKKVLLNFSSTNLKVFSLKFYHKYAGVLLVNFIKKYVKDYLLFLNKEFSLHDISNKIFSTLNMFFKIKLYKYSRKVRKILKNRIKFYTVYNFVKPDKRIQNINNFLKFCVRLTEGNSFEDRFFNAIAGVVLNEKKSWIVRLKQNQELTAISNYNFNR